MAAPEFDQYFNKQYVLEENCNRYKQLLSELGVSLFLRQIAVVIKPTVELSKETENRYVFTCKSTYREVAIRFAPDVPQAYRTIDGRDVRLVFVFEEGNRLSEMQTDLKTGEKLKTIWVFGNSDLYEYIYYRNIKATRTYRVVGTQRGWLDGAYDPEGTHNFSDDSD